MSGQAATWPPGSPADEADFLRAVDYHGAAGITRAALRAHPVLGVPDDVTRALDAAAAGIAARNSLRIREAASLVGALGGEGVRPVALKGLALLAVAYEHVGLRPMADLDFLVKPGELPAADAVLRSIGYARGLEEAPERVHHWCYARENSGIDEAVEIHRHLFAAPPLDALAPTDELMDRSVASNWSHLAVDVLCPADLLLHVAGHLAIQHAGHERLIWVADVDRVVRSWPAGAREARWDGVWARARAWRVAPALADALVAAHHWFGTPVQLEASGPAERGAYDRMRRRAPVGWEGARLLHDLGESASWRERLARFREAAFPSRDFMKAWYGIDGSWRLAAAYARRWVHGSADIVANARRAPTTARDPQTWMVQDTPGAPHASRIGSSRAESEPLP